MTSEEKTRCITAFKQFSWGKNGKIRVKKLAKVMRRAGFAPTDNELVKVFQRFLKFNLITPFIIQLSRSGEYHREDVFDTYGRI